MKKLGIVILMAVAVAAYKDRRALEDFPPYQAAHQHPPFHEQHQPFREQSFKSQYQSYRQRPYRQDMPSFAEQLPFRDRQVFTDFPSARSRPFFDDGPSFRDSADLKRQTPFYLGGSSFRDQTSFKGEQILDQSLSDQFSYQQPSFRDDFRFSDLYDKPTDSYKGHEQSDQSVSFVRDSEYLKHGNHGLGYVSVPPISPYENALPLNEETSTTTPSTAPPTTQKSLLQSTVTSTSAAISQVHTSATSEPKTASYSATMPSVKSDTLAKSAATGASTPTAATVAAATAKQSSSLNEAAFTTSLPVATEAPLLSFGRQTLPPIEFQAGKFTTPASYYVTSGLKGKLQQSLLSYLLRQQAKTPIKSNDHSSLLNYALPDVLNNSLNNKIQAQTLNYVLPEESKAALKDNWLHYLLQPESNRGLSFQQSSLSEAVNYIPLSSTMMERPKLTLPSVPVATLSAISRPLQTFNYAPSTIPKMSAFVAQDSSALPLGASLPSTLGSSIPVAPSTNIFNSLPHGMSGISAGIASGITPTLPISIPTLNLGQNFQHIGQVRQFEAPRSQPLSYSTGLQMQNADAGLQIQNADTGLQMQLGGFGGMDYTLRSSNPVSRPFELGIAKVGLSLPEMPRQQLPTFTKIGLGQHMW